MSVIMDACDQTNVDCPFFRDKPKFWDKADRLKTKMGAVLIHGSDAQLPPELEGAYASSSAALYFFPTDQRTTKGQNFWCTALTHALVHYRDHVRKGPLPERLYLQADSASDNKNYTVAAYLEWLVRAGVFKKVKISFLPVGHTHEDIDAAFGRLSKAMHRLRTGKVTTWHQVFEAAKQSTATTAELLPISGSAHSGFSFRST
jgi:hypothetical protein